MDNYENWIAWEKDAKIKGWDFSRIDGLYEEEDPPWDYHGEILSRLRPDSRLMDIDTGGGEFLLELGHDPHRTTVTEAYPPNVDLCRRVLSPLGIRVIEASGNGPLPVPDESVDLLIDRNGDLNPREFYRVLVPGGVCITQQVGDSNDRELVDLLLPGTPRPFPRQTLDLLSSDFLRAGFRLETAREAYAPLRFFDIGALVWFAHVIEWEFPGFSVDACRDRLEEAQKILGQKGEIACLKHRLLFIAVKDPVR